MTSQNMRAVSMVPSSRPSLSRLVRWVTPRMTRAVHERGASGRSHIRGAVGGAVIDNDHLPGVGATEACLHDRRHRRRFVSRRDDDVDGHRSLTTSYFG